jgi:nitrate/TMAO reductase-like tetraheme cytochrome c subunit
MKKISQDIMTYHHARKNSVINAKCALRLIPFYQDACTDKTISATASYFAGRD